MQDLNTAGGSAKLGSLGVRPLLEVANIPSILAEWAALIPLLCHLTGRHHDHEFIGEAALAGCIRINLFPRLGVLQGIAQLLEEGPDFSDRASSTGGRRVDVWDVNWGGVFPCANGAASAMVAACTLQAAHPTIRIPDHISLGSSCSETSLISVGSEKARTSGHTPTSSMTPSKSQENGARGLTIHKNVDLSALNPIFSNSKKAAE